MHVYLKIVHDEIYLKPLCMHKGILQLSLLRGQRHSLEHGLQTATTQADSLLHHFLSVTQFHSPHG